MSPYPVRAASSAIVLSLLAVCSTACSERLGQGWDWKRMRVQPRYAAYSVNPFYADSSGMRVPPTGTVSRDAPGAGPRTPTADSADLVRGAARYHVFCAVCHGERGDGVSVVGRNMDDPKPPSLIAAPARDLSVDRLFDVIGSGLGRMPPFAGVLPASDRRDVAFYVMSLGRAGESIPKQPEP